MPNITFRKATIEDLELLKYWDTKPHVIASDPDDDWNWEFELKRDPSWREQIIAELGQIPIGIFQIIDPEKEETNYWNLKKTGFRAIDIWIGEEENLSKGYGTIMMEYAISICFQADEVHTILIDPLSSNTRAIAFYKRLGFEFLEDRQFDKVLCSVFQLKRTNWALAKDI